MDAAYVQRVGSLAGNRAIADRIGTARRPRVLQRVEINKDMGGETIYENPKAVKDPTAAQKQFVATPYTNVAKYRMERSATS